MRYVAGTVDIHLIIEPFGSEKGFVVSDCLQPGEDTLTGYSELMGRLRRAVMLAIENGRLPTTPRKPNGA